MRSADEPAWEPDERHLAATDMNERGACYKTCRRCSWDCPRLDIKSSLRPPQAERVESRGSALCGPREGGGYKPSQT